MPPPKMVFDGTKWDAQFHTAADALKPRPPTKYVINPILPEASLSIFYGLPGRHKTNIVMDAAVCVALNQMWLKGDSFEGFNIVSAPIMWIDADSGIDLLYERFAALLMSHGKNPVHRCNAKLHYASFLDPAFVVSDDAAINEVIRRTTLAKAKMLVFDNLGTISGGVDENSPLMIPVMNRLRFIAEKTRAAVVIIHHITKNGHGEKGKEQRKSPRGHGSIEAAVDGAYWIDAEDDVVTIRQTKARRSPVGIFSAMYEYSHKPDTRDLQTMTFKGIEPQLPSDMVRARQTLSEYFRTRKEGNQSNLVKVLMENKIGETKARSILHTFERCNYLLVKSGQAHNQRVYLLGNPKATIHPF